MYKKLTVGNIKKYTLGTWQFGGDGIRNPENDDEGDIQAVKMHIGAGVNQIFTAQNYAEGWAEKLVGQAIKGYPRDSLILSTAIRKDDSSYDDMLRSIEGSLERLGVDYVDVVVHHAPIPEVPISESVRALNAIVDRGVARGLAVSNYNSNSMRQALAATNHPILFNQVYYNLFVREIEQGGVLKFCQDNGVLIQAFRPLELGGFENSAVPVLIELASKYSLTKSQLALAWLVSQRGVTVVSTTHNPEHLKQNLKAMEVKLSEEDVERLRFEFPAKTLEKIWIR